MPTDEPNNPELAADPMNPRPRRDLSAEGQAESVSNPFGPQELGTDEAAGGADNSPYDTASTPERHADAQGGRDGHKGNPGTGATRNG